jgi:hypothetical protein
MGGLPDFDTYDLEFSRPSNPEWAATAPEGYGVPVRFPQRATGERRITRVLIFGAVVGLTALALSACASEAVEVDDTAARGYERLVASCLELASSMEARQATRPPSRVRVVVDHVDGSDPDKLQVSGTTDVWGTDHETWAWECEVVISPGKSVFASLKNIERD